MREIIFRGKEKPGVEWAEGYIQILPSGEVHIVYTDKEFCSSTMCSRCVDPESVCQYTGLTDKNGRKIYEGDIVRDHFDASVMGIVRYGEYRSVFNDDAFTGHVGFYIEWQKRKDVLRKDLGYWARNSEFIGNIFDNPELLEETAE